MHLVGAVLTFGVGALYILVQVLLSLCMQPHVHGKNTFWVRLGVGLWTLTSIITSILYCSGSQTCGVGTPSGVPKLFGVSPDD